MAELTLDDILGAPKAGKRRVPKASRQDRKYKKYWGGDRDINTGSTYSPFSYDLDSPYGRLMRGEYNPDDYRGDPGLGDKPQIDHRVPVGEHHKSGGYRMNPEAREAFNVDTDNLMRMSASENTRKLDSGPGLYLPPDVRDHDDYVRAWMETKRKHGLDMDFHEKRMIEQVLQAAAADPKRYAGTSETWKGPSPMGPPAPLDFPPRSEAPPGPFAGGFPRAAEGQPGLFSAFLSTLLPGERGLDLQERQRMSRSGEGGGGGRPVAPVGLNKYDRRDYGGDYREAFGASPEDQAVAAAVAQAAPEPGTPRGTYAKVMSNPEEVVREAVEEIAGPQPFVGPPAPAPAPMPDPSMDPLTALMTGQANEADMARIAAMSGGEGALSPDQIMQRHPETFGDLAGPRPGQAQAMTRGAPAAAAPAGYVPHEGGQSFWDKIRGFDPPSQLDGMHQFVVDQLDIEPSGTLPRDVVKRHVNFERKKGVSTYEALLNLYTDPDRAREAAQEFALKKSDIDFGRDLDLIRARGDQQIRVSKATRPSAEAGGLSIDEVLELQGTVNPKTKEPYPRMTEELYRKSLRSTGFSEKDVNSIASETFEDYMELAREAAEEDGVPYEKTQKLLGKYIKKARGNKRAFDNNLLDFRKELDRMREKSVRRRLSPAMQEKLRGAQVGG